MLTYFNPLTWGRWIREFSFLWLLSIPWRSVSLAIPALIVLLVLALLAVVSRSGVQSWRNDLLGTQLASAWQIDDFETAELVLRRQLAARPDDADLLYKLAIIRENREAHDEALQLMRQLVGIKRYEPAARWLLDQEYLRKQWNELEESQRKEFGQLLELLRTKAPKDVAVTQLYCDYLIYQGNLSRAAVLLEELAIQQPYRGLQAAEIARKLGNEPTAERLAKQTLEQFRQLANDDPSNSVLWIVVANCEQFLREHRSAVQTLERAIALAKTPENVNQLRQAVGEAYVNWIAFIEQSPSTITQQKLQVLEMLQLALNYAPNNPRVLMLVADKVLGTLEEDDEAIAAARESLISGASPGISHFIQGTAAMMKDDVATAEMHLSIAAQHLPKAGAILNNLAVALTARPDADLDRALKFSETAISQTPDASPHFYETRGQILLKMERYLDAVPDLERALTVPELAPVAHQSLARCYQELGQEELSREHEEASKRRPEVKN